MGKRIGGWGNGREYHWFPCFECGRRTYNVRQVSEDRVTEIYAVICGKENCHLYNIAVCYERDVKGDIAVRDFKGVDW